MINFFLFHIVVFKYAIFRQNVHDSMPVSKVSYGINPLIPGSETDFTLCNARWHPQVPEESLGSLSTRVLETRTTTGREHFACQGSGVSQIFLVIISNGEKILSNVNVVV